MSDKLYVKFTVHGIEGYWGRESDGDVGRLILRKSCVTGGMYVRSIRASAGCSQRLKCDNRPKLKVRDHISVVCNIGLV